ncbi:MAG: hypothetical protein H6625_13390 [Bdellovibrionaceae bacterium]|nr:hypothetical protein [Pseudobdellovibrionaceae bacterium]
MPDSTKAVILDLKSFFIEMVTTAINQRNVSTYPLVSKYLVDLLEFYTFSNNLDLEETLAERFLKAIQEESHTLRVEKLKKLGDTTLYISGFFGDSLKRKIVDIDYYAEIGGRAYEFLAQNTHEDTYAKVYGEISIKFLDFVDVLTIVSQKSLIQSNEDLLRLYDRYITTGSELAKEQLLEKGLLHADIKKSEQ